ncbi:MAG: Fpg/Nei family DNA glycosylase, partial [Minisyncoccia bacterium]
MPELPEAEITKQKLQILINKKVKNFWTNLKSNLKITPYLKVKKDIFQRKIKTIQRWGKAILFYLIKNNDEKILAFHLRMSGNLIIKNQKEKPSKYVHFIIQFQDGKELWFEDQRKFGIVWYGNKSEILSDSYFKKLGVDFLNLKFKDFYKIISSKKGVIKAVLLSQKNFSGIGNILADEALYLAKIHPQTKANKLSLKQIKQLWQALNKVIFKSIKAGGTSMRNWR